MQKKVLMLAAPSLIATILVSSCGGASSTITSTTQPNSSPVSSTGLPNSTSNKGYSYGKVETMEGELSLSLMNGLIASNIPIVLNYQVAQEEFGIDTFAEYVKFSMNFELAGSSKGYIDIFSIICQLFPSLISELAFQSFIDSDTQNIIDNIEFNYNADGMLYISFLDKSIIEEKEVITSLGTVGVNVSTMVSDLIMSIATKFADGFDFEDLDGLGIDMGIVLPILSALSVSFKNNGFVIRIDEEGAAPIAAALAGFVETSMPGMGEMMSQIFDLSSIVLSYSETNHELNFALNNYESVYTNGNGEEYLAETPVVNFNIGDAEKDVDNVFSGFDYLGAFADQIDILEKTKVITSVYDNMYYTKSYQEEIDNAMAYLVTLRKDNNFYLIKNIDEALGIFIDNNSGSEVTTFQRYLDGLKLVDDLFASIEKLELTVAGVNSWTIDNWLQLAPILDQLIGNEIDPRGDILSKSDRAEEGKIIIDAYKKAMTENINNLKVSISEVFSDLSKELKEGLFGASITIDSAIKYAQKMQQSIYSLKNGLTLATMPNGYLTTVSEIITDTEVILIAKLYQYIESKFEKVMSDLENNSNLTFNEVKNVIDKYVISMYGVEGESSSAPDLINSNRSNPVTDLLKTLNTYDVVGKDLIQSARKWVSKRTALISGTNSTLYNVIFSEINSICTDEDIANATSVEVLNDYKASLNTKYLEYKLVLENEKIYSYVSDSRKLYDDRIASINDKIDSFTSSN